MAWVRARVGLPVMADESCYGVHDLERIIRLGAADLDGLARWLPSNASAALMAPGGSFVEYLDWWLGGVVLLGYGIVFAGLGLLVSTRRDVS